VVRKLLRSLIQFFDRALHIVSIGYQEAVKIDLGEPSMNSVDYINRTMPGRADEQTTDCLNVDLRPTWISRGVDLLLKFTTKLAPLLLAAAFMSLSVSLTFPADQESRIASVVSSQAEPVAVSSERVEHALSQRAEEVARFFNFSITNSMVVTWTVAIGLMAFAHVATRNMKPVPGRTQNFFEWLVESLYSFLEEIIGPHLVKRTFWFFATIFIFILATNWVGLVPGVGSIGWGHPTPHGFAIDRPLFRGGNADVNMTLAMALVFFGCWIVWALQEVGPIGFLKELFAPKGESTGLLRVLMIFVFFVAGCLEIVSILFRPISLSFRLYGNIFAGENLLEAMSKLVPGFGWLVPIPFYLLELLVGLVQALVFMLLTAVFTMLICQHEVKETAVAHD
jgi:F-type H+-transporting ATPase subunit a